VIDDVAQPADGPLGDAQLTDELLADRQAAGEQLGDEQAPDELFGDEHMTRGERLRRVWRRFRKDVLRQRHRLEGGMLFSVLLGIARVIEPWPLKVVFDQVLFHRPATGPTSQIFLVFGNTPTDILTAAALVLMAAGILDGVSYYYQDYLLSTAAQSIVYSIRTRLYRHLHRLDLSFHLSRHVGDTLVRLSADIIMLRDVLIDGLVTLGSGLVMVVLMLIVMVFVDPVLTLLTVTTMPVAGVIAYAYSDPIRARSRKQRKKEGEIAALMHQSLASISVVQLHTAEAQEEERFRQANRRSLKEGTKTVRLEARMNRAIQIALAFGMVIVLWAGTLRALHGHISPGDLIVFIAYLRAAYRPLRRASKTVQRSAKAQAAAERIVEILEIQPQIADAPDARPAPPFSDRLALENLHFAYVEGEEVLSDINLELPVGCCVALVGPTGSGKSTLLALLPRLLDPASGRVTFDGTDVRDLTLQSLRSQMSIVQQEAVLMGLTIADNIRYGRPDATDEQVLSAALDAGLGPLVAQLPDGLETVVAERGASLSGGERQRVAIARALVRDTPILLLDEPTTGLDPATKAGVVETLLRVVEHRATLLITHDLALASRADEIVVLIAGKIVARGSYEDIKESAEFRILTDTPTEALS
jgi:ABC-type multidrug transport system fused ATPase/permease subunit